MLHLACTSYGDHEGLEGYIGCAQVERQCQIVLVVLNVESCFGSTEKITGWLDN
jgi:hypothetical protein